MRGVMRHRRGEATMRGVMRVVAVTSESIRVVAVTSWGPFSLMNNPFWPRVAVMNERIFVLWLAMSLVLM